MKRVYPDKNYCIGCHLCELACITAHSKSKDLIIAFNEERTQDGLSPCKRVFEKGDTCVAISCRHLRRALLRGRLHLRRPVQGPGDGPYGLRPQQVRGLLVLPHGLSLWGHPQASH